MCYLNCTLINSLALQPDVVLAADPERAFGRESRSLKAIYELYEAGWSLNNIRHVEGGFQQWKYQGLPVEGDE